MSATLLPHPGSSANGSVNVPFTAKRLVKETDRRCCRDDERRSDSWRPSGAVPVLRFRPSGLPPSPCTLPPFVSRLPSPHLNKVPPLSLCLCFSPPFSPSLYFYLPVSFRLLFSIFFHFNFLFFFYFLLFFPSSSLLFSPFSLLFCFAFFYFPFFSFLFSFSFLFLFFSFFFSALIFSSLLLSSLFSSHLSSPLLPGEQHPVTVPAPVAAERKESRPTSLEPPNGYQSPCLLSELPLSQQKQT